MLSQTESNWTEQLGLQGPILCSLEVLGAGDTCLPTQNQTIIESQGFK